MTNETPLPWVQKLSSNKKHYTISHNNINVVKDVGTLGDALYIEEACNNYPKAIELLAKIVLKYSETKRPTIKFCFNDKYTSISEIKDFLKQIKL